MIEKLFPKSCEGIVEFDYIKTALKTYVEPVLMNFVTVMRDNSHIQSMEQPMILMMSNEIFGENIYSASELLDRINTENCYKWFQFNTDFLSWRVSASTSYHLYMDIDDHTIYHTTSDLPPGENVLVITLAGEDLDVPDVQDTDPRYGRFPIEYQMSLISYKFPANILIRIVADTGDNEQRIGVCQNPIVNLELEIPMRRV